MLDEAQKCLTAGPATELCMSPEASMQVFDDVTLILDALIGYSLRGAPGGITADLIGWANQSDLPILSLDVPSGVDATTGDLPGVAMQPAGTLTLALPKTGLNDANAGDVILADIGIPVGVYRRMGLKFDNPFDGRYRVPITTVPGD